MKSDKIVIIGGDERRVYMEEYLNSTGYRTLVYEEDKAAALNELKKDYVVAIMPLPFSRDGVNINIKLSHVEMSIDYFLSLLKKGDRVFGGMINEDVVEQMLGKGVEVYDYYDEDLVLKNALLTAIGLKQVLSENEININDLKCAVTGFGRTSKAIAEMLSVSNAQFTVFVRNYGAVSQAESMNYEAVNLKHFTDDCVDYGLIINTVPAKIIGEDILCKLSEGTVIIDIASYPFGVDIDTAEKHKIKVIRALSLPGKYTPDLAGTLIGEKIKRLL